ncbi:hypothetical protein GB992_09905 [Lactobacillus rossiae]|uniref:Uncharacterized protein n=1 Tax=Furfurilactobacillus rossiae TaxID=231049 RepID=A0A7C9J314_9LACO|nr:hypothetical protein [Furfurilactobacillus milii]
MVNTILKEADLFCPNSVRINFTIYQKSLIFVDNDILMLLFQVIFIWFKQFNYLRHHLLRAMSHFLNKPHLLRCQSAFLKTNQCWYSSFEKHLSPLNTSDNQRHEWSRSGTRPASQLKPGCC